jgi:GTP-binding protein
MQFLNFMLLFFMSSNSTKTKVRNIAIIAHVDHGKTTLVDSMFRAGGLFRANQVVSAALMDRLTIEKARGITIMSKCTSIEWKDHTINILDTPGHADFGSEVQRIFGMVDAVLVLADAAEGVMPQTKFVVSKAVENKLKLLIFVNKIDKPAADPKQTADEVLDLIINMSPDDIDSPIFYGSGREGYASMNLEKAKEIGNISELLDKIIEYVPAPEPMGEDLSALVSLIDMDEYFGKLLIGRVYGGQIKVGDNVFSIKQDGTLREKFRVNKLFKFVGTKKEEVKEVNFGDIACIAGGTISTVGDTIALKDKNVNIVASPEIEQPTLSIFISANTSPLAGKDGKKLTPNQIKERLIKEAETNVGIKLIMHGDTVEVMGRGELQLGVLIEQMRQENFEMTISAPKVLLKTENGVKKEPLESVIIDTEMQYMSAVVEKLGIRGGKFLDMKQYPDRVRLFFEIPTRLLIGYISELKSDTNGTGVLNKELMGYTEYRGDFKTRQNGLLISMAGGKSTEYAMNELSSRGIFFISPGDQIYAGMIIGEHSKGNSLTVNPVKEKKLTNVRAANKDEQVRLQPPVSMTLEKAIAYIMPGECIEVTPLRVCLRMENLRV